MCSKEMCLGFVVAAQMHFMRGLPFTMHFSQVEFMGEQERKIQGDLEMREQQVQELQRARNEMYEKLMEAENSKGRHDEARLHKELAQLQVRAVIKRRNHKGFGAFQAYTKQ